MENCKGHETEGGARCLAYPSAAFKTGEKSYDRKTTTWRPIDFLLLL